MTFLDDGARDPAARPSATTDDAATPAAASSDEDEDDAENDGRFRVAVINKARRRCELTTMGADPLRVDNASFRGFDGTWSHDSRRRGLETRRDGRVPRVPERAGGGVVLSGRAQENETMSRDRPVGDAHAEPSPRTVESGEPRAT